MIYIGLTNDDKIAATKKYIIDKNIKKVVVISIDSFPLFIDGADQVSYSDVIMYVTYYRLLQEIDHHTLIVLNEVLRIQNRYDLTYNCIRHYLNQTEHQLIFQQLPQIDNIDDFMILFDFDTRSRWKQEKFDVNLVLDNSVIDISQLKIDFNRIDVPTSDATKRKYTKERNRRFATIGAKDPHTIPRNLHLVGGNDKIIWIDSRTNDCGQMTLFGDKPSRQYVARNQRLKRNNIFTYANVEPQKTYTLIDFPHRFIEFSDFIKTTNQTKFDFLATDLKVDDWYFDRYQNWKERINATYASLREG